MINATQKELARHALGLPNSKRISYRNRFVCSDTEPEWNAMVQDGLATMRKSKTLLFDGDACFYLTRKGAEAALEPREKLCPEDFPVTHTRPILFSAPMIRALVDGSKVQTRRMLKKQPHIAPDGLLEFSNGIYSSHPLSMNRLIKDQVPFAVGDSLWVREAWRCNGWATDLATIMYKAHERCSYTEMTEQIPNTNRKFIKASGTWKPSIFMPRWISRLTLTITEVRVERLQDISETDAIAEGCGQYSSTTPLYEAFDAGRKGSYSEGFRELWNNLNAKRGFGWDTNPWVSALTFTVEKRNIDQVQP